MKRFLFNIFVIMIIMICLIPTKVMAIVVNLPIYFPDLKDRKETIKYVKSFSEEYQEAKDAESGAKIKVKVFKEGKGEYYIGNDKEKVKFDLRDGTELFDEGDMDVGSTWKVWLDITYMEGLNNGENNQGINVVSSYTEDGVFDNGPTTAEAAKEGAKNIANKAKGAVKKVYSFAKKLEHNFGGTLLTLILDIIKVMFGDLPQSFFNMVVTSSNRSLTDWKLKYSYDSLLKEGKDGERNKYTKVSEYSEGSKADWQVAVKDIKKDGTEFESFSEDTDIIVIKADLYNVAMGHIPLVDTNFLTGSENHEENSLWTKLRNIAAALIHISIYIAAAILVTTLIFTGIQIVRFSFTDPIMEWEYKEKLKNFATSVATLVGIIIFMALCIFGTNEAFSLIQRNNDTYELPIRVNVESAGYSFSTPMAGYAGYMASMQNVDKSAEKAYYTFSYIVLVWLNMLVVVFMFIRMLILMLLSSVGPISAALSVFDISGPMRLKRWAFTYLVLSLAQVLLAFVCQAGLKMKF